MTNKARENPRSMFAIALLASAVLAFGQVPPTPRPAGNQQAPQPVAPKPTTIKPALSQPGTAQTPTITPQLPKTTQTITPISPTTPKTPISPTQVAPLGTVPRITQPIPKIPVPPPLAQQGQRPSIAPPRPGDRRDPEKLGPILDRLRVEADTNRNGTLDQTEIKAFAEQIQALLDSKHKVLTPLDRYFDKNRDGAIGDEEIEIGRTFFFFDLLPNASLKKTDLLSEFFGDALPEGERRSVAIKDIPIFLFGDPSLSQPHVASKPIDRALDIDKNGSIDNREITRGKNILFGAAARAALPTREENTLTIEPGPVQTLLAELIDTNTDGILDVKEISQAKNTLSQAHSVRSPLDAKIDYNRNGTVDDWEIARAKKTSTITSDKMELRVPRPAVTISDSLLDLDGNRSIEEKEIDLVANLAATGQITPGLERLASLVDADRSGALSRSEILKLLDDNFRPRPVLRGDRFDTLMDSNRDGFLSPEEIGVGAGFSTVGSTSSLDARIEKKRLGLVSSSEQSSLAEGNTTQPSLITAASSEGKSTFTSGLTSAIASASSPAASTTSAPTNAATNFDREHVDLSGRKLAIAEIIDATKSLETDDLDGLILFVQNAFVNIGKTTIVERSALDAVLKEIETQMALGNEKALGELGKSASADILAVGSLSRLGETWYLNLKLIGVDSNEVIGSAVENASGADGFYDMATNVVLKLF